MRYLLQHLPWAIIGAAALLLLNVAVPAAEPAAAPVFERDIRPILKAACFHCHGDEPELQGSLDLRLRRLMVAGGDSGPALEPGKPETSLLLERLRAGEMPPGESSRKVSAGELDRIAAWIAAGAPTAHPEPLELQPGFWISPEDRKHWAFQPVRRPGLPRVQGTEQIRNPIDAFVLAGLEEQGDTFSPPADRRTLLRRAWFDLLGLPPSPEDIERFLADESDLAFDREIDRLLTSPRYGERWGRHWLDVAGYADSDGDADDHVREYAYRYRDYVIRVFNADKPFDAFIREQLAGDELAGPIQGGPTPEQAEQLIATGFLQMAPDGTPGATDKRAAHNQLMADTIEIVSSSLLGLTVGCARCHDHRFDPISQEDYYRFRAIFEPALDSRNWDGKARLIKYSTADDRQQAAGLLQQRELAIVERVLEAQLEKLPKASQSAALAALETPEAQRSEEQQQLLVDSKLNVTADNLEEFDRRAMQELRRLRAKSAADGFIQTIRESGGNVPKTYLFHRGNPQEPRHAVDPAEPAILAQASAAELPPHAAQRSSSGRRLAYARHLTDGKHPLVARVIVNRVWMQHFGRGLCATTTDFGTHGESPSHPELLDWLADEFVRSSWSLKQLHRLIMTSTVYRQGPHRSQELVRRDPDNRLLGAFPVRRLEAEVVRDAILATSGQLDLKTFGVAVPVMRDPAGEIVIGLENTNAGIPLAVVPMFGEECRRSVYVQVRRSMPLTFMQMFDAPELDPNCEARTVSTVAPQSLVMMNSPFILQQSLRFAERVRREAGGDTDDQIRRAWELAYARLPTGDELADARSFLQSRSEYFREHPPTVPEKVDVPGSRSQAMRASRSENLIESASQAEPDTLALALLCQMLLSSNEFLYIG